MQYRNPKPISEIRKEEEQNQLPMSDVYQMISQLNADMAAFFEHYFSQFPDQA